MERAERGFGVAGALPHAIVREVARAAEAAAYRTFWVNDTPNGDGLAALREAADVTATIRLGVGVIPLDRRPPQTIAQQVAALGLPVERLTLGIGAGGAAGGVERVRLGITDLRRAEGATIVVGALGPRMCRLAGEVADGALLNWLTPEHAGRSIKIVEEAAAEAHRSRPRIDGYVRTALGTEAIRRLREEAARYAAIPAYAAHFERMGTEAIRTVVAGETGADLQNSLTQFDAVLDETVVRAVTGEETAAAYLAVLTAGAPTAVPD